MIASVNVMNAQMTFGIRGGLNLGNISGIGSAAAAQGSGVSVSTSMGVGFHVGAILNYDINDNLAFAPELLYTTVNCKETMSYSYTFFGQTYSGSGTGTNVLSYIQLPLLLKYSLNKEEGLNFSAGPYLGILAGASSTSTSVSNGQSSSSSSSSDSSNNKLDIGLALGVGYLLPMGLGFDLRYNIGLANDYKSSSYTDSNGNTQTQAAYGKNGVIMLSFRYMLGMGKK